MLVSKCHCTHTRMHTHARLHTHMHTDAHMPLTPEPPENHNQEENLAATLSEVEGEHRKTPKPWELTEGGVALRGPGSTNGRNCAARPPQRGDQPQESWEPDSARRSCSRAGSGHAGPADCCPRDRRPLRTPEPPSSSARLPARPRSRGRACCAFGREERFHSTWCPNTHL